jgi:hypothetical protein
MGGKGEERVDRREQVRRRTKGKGEGVEEEKGW